MKKNIILIVSCIITIIISTCSISYAWYANYYVSTENDDIELASKQGYYESGSGASNDPYVISHPIHLYNFAWLQDLGYYDDGVYYFQLKNNIDMNDINTTIGALPPVGIDSYGVGTKGDTTSTNEHPFKGVFNGLYEGTVYKISNLIISTDPTDFKLFPDLVRTTTGAFNSNFQFGNSVGFFGKTYGEFDSSTNILDSANSSSITNVIIDGISIESNQTNGNIGVVGGYVDGAISRIGVINPSLTVNNSTLVNCNNLLVGYYNSSLRTDFPTLGDQGESKTNLELDIDKIVEEGANASDPIYSITKNPASASINLVSDAPIDATLTPTDGNEFYFYKDKTTKVDLNGIRIFGGVTLQGLNDGSDWNTGNVHDKTGAFFEFRLGGAMGISNNNIPTSCVVFTTTGPGKITVDYNANSAGRNLGLWSLKTSKDDNGSISYSFANGNKDNSRKYLGPGTLANQSQTLEFDIDSAGTYAFGSQRSEIDITKFIFDYDDVINGNAGGGSSDTSTGNGYDLNYVDVISQNDSNNISYDSTSDSWSNWERWELQVRFTLTNTSIYISVSKQYTTVTTDSETSAVANYLFNITDASSQTFAGTVTMYNPREKNIIINGTISSTPSTSQLIRYPSSS